MIRIAKHVPKDNIGIIGAFNVTSELELLRFHRENVEDALRVVDSASNAEMGESWQEGIKF